MYKIKKELLKGEKIMAKIIKTIVGPDRKLLGFIMEGKEDYQTR